jgi:hypothetical protein
MPGPRHCLPTDRYILLESQKLLLSYMYNQNAFNMYCTYVSQPRKFSSHVPLVSKVLGNQQGDQIGRILAYGEIVYVRQFLLILQA